jgi:hypothetical protein
MAMFIQRADPDPGWGGCRSTALQPDRLPYSAGLSPYWLNTAVRLAPDHGLTGLDNVIELDATVDSEDDRYDHADTVLIAYLQRDFTATYAYDPDNGTTRRITGSAATGQPAVRCTADGAYCLGMYFRAADLPGAYYYTLTRDPLPSNGNFGEYATQVTAPAPGVGRGGTTRLTSVVYLAVGNLSRVTGTIRELHHRVG